MLRAPIVAVLLVLNLIFAGSPVALGGIVKRFTWGSWRDRITLFLLRLGENWISNNNRIFDALLDTEWVVDPIPLSRDERYLVLSNHISWIDIIAVQRAFLRRAPFVRFFLKQELIWAPILGVACWAVDFPFMKRYSRAYLERHPEKRGQDLETTRRACKLYDIRPVTILNFLEGTRFTPKKKVEQQSPYENLLRPRIGGAGYVLAAMGRKLDAVIDATVIYPTGDVTMLDLLLNRVPRVTLRMRRLEVPPEFTTDEVTQPGPTRDRFRDWIDTLWREKDARIASER